MITRNIQEDRNNQLKSTKRTIQTHSILKSLTLSLSLIIVYVILFRMLLCGMYGLI